jgi:hypothetical protein
MLARDFPNTLLEPVVITSPQTWDYNCIAWAFGDNTKWYWPTDHPSFFWPPNIRRQLDIQSFIELYQLVGYQICNNSNVEIGFEKIAVFAFPNGEPTHAAKQLLNGNWTSKMGSWHDVEHTLNSLSNSPGYGNPVVFMSRPIV